MSASSRTDLVERVFEAAQAIEAIDVLKTVTGARAGRPGRSIRHPFIDRTGPVVAADYVTTTDGTGLVHTAPGHGEDDYETGVREGLDVYSPVLANGRFDDTAPEWLRGKTVWEANPLITDELQRRRRAVRRGEDPPQLPARLAEQDADHLPRHRAVVRRDRQAVRRRREKPAGPTSLRRAGDRTRSRASVEFRPRLGPAPDRAACSNPGPTGASRASGRGDCRSRCSTTRRASRCSRPNRCAPSPGGSARRVSDAWFTESPAELLGRDFGYPPGFDPENLRKEKDIFDVWFESGSSWHAVLQCRTYLHFPADLYLEGSDQHRGWFQLSLLPSLGATAQPPFKQVLTHGFVVKPDGTKVSKSDKEYVTATQEINRHGADLLRLWCCSVDYQGDIPASPKAIQEFGDKYRKIRNTLRYLLSNLYDFNPHRRAADVPPNSLDGWASAELDHADRAT